jgi:hypothetical protein
MTLTSRSNQVHCKHNALVDDPTDCDHEFVSFCRFYCYADIGCQNAVAYSYRTSIRIASFQPPTLCLCSYLRCLPCYERRTTITTSGILEQQLRSNASNLRSDESQRRSTNHLNPQLAPCGKKFGAIQSSLWCCRPRPVPVPFTGPGGRRYWKKAHGFF